MSRSPGVKMRLVHVFTLEEEHGGYANYILRRRLKLAMLPWSKY